MSDFLRQSVTKLMGKTAIWEILYFYSLLPLNNIEKQWAKFAFRYFMGAQHCIGGDGEVLVQFLKFRYFLTACACKIVKWFVNWFSYYCLTKNRGVLMHLDNNKKHYTKCSSNKTPLKKWLFKSSRQRNSSLLQKSLF